MQSEGKIIWLASYPKSGNTWFRSFLTALLEEKEEVDINEMVTDGIFSGKGLLENVLDVNSDYLNKREIEVYQKMAYTHFAAKAKETKYIKIHDAFTYSESDGSAKIPTKYVRMAVYLIRNPLDVALSFANHLGKEIDNTIDKFLINPEGGMLKKLSSANNQFQQPLGTWAMHVESWQKQSYFPVHFMRYEDMLSKPFETFKTAVDAMGLSVSDTQIEQAIAATAFEKLKRKEEELGFAERSSKSKSFFFKGQSGRWKTELNEEQVEKIKKTNEPMMRAFGYWN